MQPNPLQYLAYWAGRTSRVDLGTAVIVAPWWNPVRLASEINMLDILLKGRRLHLGIGRGVAPHEYASLGIPIEQSHTYYYDVVNAIKASDGAERFTFDGEVFKIPPTTIRPQGRHKGDLTTRIKAAFSTKKSAQLAAEAGLGQMFVSGDDVDEMTNGVKQFNEIRAGLGLPPDQPTTLLWMYCAETEEEAEEGWVYFHNQLLAAQHHYFEWNNPGFKGVKGYEEYETRQTADVGVADASLNTRAQPPDRHARADHREDRDHPEGHEPRDARDPLLLRRHAGGEGGEEPAAVRREGAAAHPGHGHAAQPGARLHGQGRRLSERRQA